MTEYVNRCTLEVNGQSIDDFKAVTEKKRTIAKPVKLMNKQGTAGVTPEYGAMVDYVVPQDTSEFDFDAVKDGTLVIEYENGKRIRYSEVRTLEIGEAKIDGDNELVKAIDLFASGRKEE